MSPTRTFNVLTLTLILFLAGCFGIGDSAEAADDHDHTPNAAPVLHAELMLDDGNGEIEFNMADCSLTDCNVTSYHAAVDPDGDLMDLGYDFDLDGTIDYQLINPRGVTNLQIPRTEFVESILLIDEVVENSNCVNGQQLVVTETSTITHMKTTIALIAVDSNDAASALLITTNELYDISTIISDSTEECSTTSDGPWTFSDRDASGDMSSDAGDALVHVQMTSGDGLSWAVLKVSIVVDGGASYTCEEGDATAPCTYSKDDDKSWDTSEEITISEGATDMCGSDDSGCEVVVTLTKLGVGEEDDKVIATVTAFADAN